MSAGELRGACSDWVSLPTGPLMERLRVTVEYATSEDPSYGPVCPHCREPLRGNLRQEQVAARQTADPGPGLAMTLTYCGRCGWTLHLAPARADGPAGHGLAADEEVAAPADEQALEGQFQLRCRDLIGEIRSLGFNPNVWVAMINSRGAAGAAKKLLADHHMLVVTPWLVRQAPGQSSRWSTRSGSRDGPDCSPMRNAPRRRGGWPAPARRRTGAGAG